MTAAVLDITAALRALLEPVGPGQAVVDLSDAEPFTWEGDTFYLYPIANAETAIETGPTARQDFGLMAVYVADSHEEADMERSQAVSAALDAKRAQYIDAVRMNRVTTTWHHIRAAERPNPPRTLQSRAVAIEIRGYRVIS